MKGKLLSSNTLRAVVIVFVMLAASFVLLVQTNVVSAQGASDTQLVVGLQNPATSLNFFDVATNSVWKAYMLEYNFEALFTYDPDSKIYSDLASDQAIAPSACPAGQSPGPYNGMCHDAEFLNFTVFLHSGITFTDGQPLTADDVVFSYQSLAWSTNAQVIYPALWWPQPMVPLWNESASASSCTAPAGMPYACMSHTAVKKIAANEIGFQLLPVYTGGVKGAYALFFYATMVVPIIPMHIWQTHMMPIALNNWSASSGSVSDTWDRGINTNFTPYTCAQAGLPAGCYPYIETIGTGPFYLDNYVANSQTVLKVYDSYWGKGLSHTWNNAAFPFFPVYLKSVKFQIFTSLDVVSLALQQGSIDTLVWSLTPGFYTQVKANPAITVTSVTDSGFFYISFNMRRKPWDDLCLRQAVSKAIDKSYITGTLMGGFGIAGTVPISVVNPAYVNASASPPAFDKSGIIPLLTSSQCGYTVDSSTGFVRAPAREGGQIVSATILTPPKDYDPVRADAGTMISKNLKDVGVNIGAAPTSFDTIVSRGLTYGQVDYDIYILGWSLGIFPETYICSFFCQGQDVQTNIAGSNSAGYANATVDNLIQQLTYTVDTPTRINLMQKVEGIVTNAIPWNVLYYRKNLNAFRNDKFAGWQDNPVLNALSAGGGPYNYYTLVNLKPASAPPIGGGGALTVTATIPQHLLASAQVPLFASVSQNGVPVSGATVTFTATLASGTVLNTVSATTGATGIATALWTVPFIQGDMFMTVTGTSGSSTGFTLKQLTVTIGPPAPMALLSLSTPTPVIPAQGTGNSSVVTATLVNGKGQGIADATVHIDTTLILGKMSSSSAVTDTSGHATFTYTPPPVSKFPNAHQIDTIRANATVPSTIVADTQTATLSIFVQNDLAPDWVQVKVQGTPGLVFGPLFGNTTTVAVKATDYLGAAVQGVTVEGSLNTGEHNVTVTPATATTDASGIATFRVTNAGTWSLGESQNVVVRFQAVGLVASTSDQIAFLLSDGVTAGYAARISFNRSAVPYTAAGSDAVVTAHVVDQANISAVGAQVAFQIGYGDLGIPAEFNWSFDYNAWAYGHDGLALNALGGGSVGGDFASSTATNDIYGVENLLNDAEVLGPGPAGLDSCAPFDGWDGSYIINATSVTNAFGQVSASFKALPMPKDSEMRVFAYVGAPGQTMAVLVNTCSPLTAFSHAAFRIDSGAVIQRAPGFALGSATTNVTEFTSLSRTLRINATFYKLGGVVASHVQVFAVRGQGSGTRNVLGTFGGTMTTDANGQISFTNTVPYLGASQAYFYGVLPADPTYSFGGREQLYGGIFGDYFFSPLFQVLIAKFPFQFQRGYMFIPYSQAFAMAVPLQPFLPLGGTTPVGVEVFNANASTQPLTSGIAGASVWSGAQQASTNASGFAVFNYTAPVGASGALEGLVVVTTPTGQAVRAWFSVMASAPVLTYGTITPTLGLAGQSSTFSSQVTNTVPVAGTATVLMIVDNQTVASKAVTVTALGTAVVTFSYVFTTAGSHTVAIGTASLPVTVQPQPNSIESGTAYALAGGLLVVGVVVGVLVGMMLSRRRKKPSAAMPEETSETKPAEEELPPEDKL